MKKYLSIGAAALAVLMLAGCRSGKNPTVTTDGWEGSAPSVTVGQGTEQDTLPGVEQPKPDSLPYTVRTAHQAGDRIFTGSEWTGGYMADVNGDVKWQT